MSYLSVKNYERFQHYRDRAPPWIKFHAAVLDDYEFGQLPDASKAHLLAIWLLASKLDNRIPNDSKWIARKINATERVDIDTLVRSGFLLMRDASGPLAEREHDSMLEERRGEERESRGEGERAPARARATRLPDDWEPSEDLKAWAAGSEPTVDSGRETLKFKDYWRSAAGSKARKLDWDAAWRGWIRRAAETVRPNGQAPPASAGKKSARMLEMEEFLRRHPAHD